MDGAAVDKIQFKEARLVKKRAMDEPPPLGPLSRPGTARHLAVDGRAGGRCHCAAQDAMPTSQCSAAGVQRCIGGLRGRSMGGRKSWGVWTARCPISLCWAAGGQDKGEEVAHLGKSGERREGGVADERERPRPDGQLRGALSTPIAWKKNQHTQSSPAQPYRSGAV